MEVQEVSCLGRCDRAPAACVGHRSVKLDDPEAVDAALAQGGGAGADGAGLAADEESRWSAGGGALEAAPLSALRSNATPRESTSAARPL